MSACTGPALLAAAHKVLIRQNRLLVVGRVPPMWTPSPPSASMPAVRSPCCRHTIPPLSHPCSAACGKCPLLQPTPPSLARTTSSSSPSRVQRRGGDCQRLCARPQCAQGAGRNGVCAVRQGRKVGVEAGASQGQWEG